MTATGQKVYELQESLQILAGAPGVDAVGAANIWAGTMKNGSPTLGLIAALNAKNGTLTGGKLLDLNLVCNQLAGTTNLSAQLALHYLAGGS